MIAARLMILAGSVLGASEAVTVEALRLVGVAISCAASIVGAVLAYRNGREARAAKREAAKARREARSRRHVVRDPANEHALVVDTPAPPPLPPDVPRERRQ